MMRVLGLLLIGLLVVPVAADSGLTLWGSRGGVALPTADVVGHRQTEVAVDWYDTESDDTLPVRVNYGLTDRLDVGGYVAFNDLADMWGVNAKFDTRFPKGHGGTSLGFRFTHVDNFDADGWQVYAVHTHNFGPVGFKDNLRLSVGANWTSIEFLSLDDDDIRFFAILEAIRKKWTFGAEIQSDSDDLGENDPLTSFWARYRYTDRWTFQGGLTNSGPGGLVSMDDHELFFGMSYLFGPEGTSNAPNLGGMNHADHY